MVALERVREGLRRDRLFPFRISRRACSRTSADAFPFRGGCNLTPAQTNGDRLLGGLSTRFSLSHMVHFFPDEFPGLRARRLPLASIFTSAI